MDNKERGKKKGEKKERGSWKDSFTTRKFRGGAYATVLSVIAVALVIAVNMLASKLDIRFDMTEDGRYSLHDETIGLLEGLKDDITIYYLAVTGQELQEFDRIFSKYDDYGSRVTIAYKDPVLHPKFAAQYVDDSVKQNSFLVVNESSGKAKYVDYSDILIQELNYNTWQFVTTGYDLEGRLDAAIQYVTNEDLPVVYRVTGHGESSLASALSDLLERSNVTLNEIQLISAARIPEDCDILLFCQPQSDYTEEEAAMVRGWLEQGGYGIFLLDYMTPLLKNYNGLLQYYGLETHEGVVIEGSSDYYMNQRPYMLLPTVYSSDITDSVRKKKYVVTPWVTGVTLRDDQRDSISVTKLLYTSDNSYIKALDSDTLEKREGDKEGPFYVGLTLSETVSGGETKIAVYSARDFLINDIVGNTYDYGNDDIFLNTISRFTEQESAVAVPTVSLEQERVVLSSAEANRIAVLVAVVLPLAIIGTGVFVVVRRRKK
ncbi:MAG: GldG family protein [Lachnospiraceae bacterium]|nr:GldG family protein [Lachnospiraceae bacterium]